MQLRFLIRSFLAVGMAGAAFSNAQLTSALSHGPDSAPAAFIVVAPRRFHGALGGFADHKRRSLTTELVALEDVLSASPGADDPERLKRFLFDAWKARATRYVLLVGDADVMPVRYMVLDRVTPAAFDYAFYPSDLYYADVARADGSFDDWNGRHDGFHAGYYGEVRGEKNKSDPMNFDAVDYRPDLALGRWPVSTPEEVATVAAKTIAFEAALAREPAPEPRAAVIAVGGWIDSRGTMTGMAERLPTGWSSVRCFYADPGTEAPAATAPACAPDEEHVVQLLNDGTTLVLHAGHGGDDRWEGCLSIASIARLANADRPAIMLSAGCSTARLATLPPYEGYVDVAGMTHTGTNAGEVFTAPPPAPAPYQRAQHNPTGLGEQLLRAGPAGAVAYFGCNTGSQPCGLTLLEGFVETLATGETPRLGDCWAGAVAHYYDKQGLATLKPTEDWYPASIFFQGMKFMLFGDPTLRMPAPARR